MCTFLRILRNVDISLFWPASAQMSEYFFGPILRAGRALADISQEQLATAAKVSRKTIARLEESGETRINTDLLNKIRLELARRGVEFSQGTDDFGMGVRIKSPKNVLPTISEEEASS